MILFEQKVQPTFAQKVVDVAGKLGINPSWLMWIMNNESGLNPQAQNKTYLVHGQPATGLIQFIDTTAANLGTSIQALYNMQGVEQLDYVYKYFKPYTGKIKSLYDLYLITFFPLALGKPDNWVFETKGISRAAIAKGNPIFDLNKDGQITVGEFKQAIYNRVNPADRSFVFKAGLAGGGALLLAGLFFLGRYLYRKSKNKK